MAKKDKRDGWLVFGQAYGTFLVVAVPLLIFLLASVGDKKAKKKAEVNAQVEAYEKTLPGYMEQKQMVEHYRDSLMGVKSR